MRSARVETSMSALGRRARVSASHSHLRQSLCARCWTGELVRILHRTLTKRLRIGVTGCTCSSSIPTRRQIWRPRFALLPTWTASGTCSLRTATLWISCGDLISLRCGCRWSGFPIGRDNSESPNQTLHPTAARRRSRHRHRMFGGRIRSGRPLPAAVGELCGSSL